MVATDPSAINLAPQPAPTLNNLPSGFTAPAGSQISQGAGNSTQPTQPTGALAPTPSTGSTPAIPPVTSTINSSVLTPATPIPYATPNPTPLPDVQSLDAQVTPPLTPTGAEGQESDLDTQLESLNNSLVGKSAYQTQENTINGVDSLNAQQNDLAAQLTSLQDQAKAIPQQLQLDATGRGITANGMAPVQTAALRNNSIQALTISSMLDASKGLLANAQAKANAAVAAKYDPITEKINAATANLKLIQDDPNTSLEDKNRAAAQADALKTQENQLATAKQNATDVLSVATKAAANGADATTLQKIQNAPDGAAALSIASKAGFGTNPLDEQSKKLGLENTELDIATKQQALANPSGPLPGTTGTNGIDVTQTGYSSTAVPGAGGLSQAAIDQAALSFAMTGTMPSMGLGSTGAAGQRRVAIQNRAAELDAGGNIQENKAELSANTKTLATQTAYLNTTQRSLTNAENGLNQLTSAFGGKVNDQSMPIANVLENAVKYNLGSGDVNAYKAALAEVGNEYSQVFSRGGTVTDSVRGRANDIINGNISVADLKTVSDELQAQGNIVLQGAQQQVQSVQNTINGIISGTNSSTAPAIGTTVTDTSNIPDGTIVNDGTSNYIIKGGKPIKQ